jgi:hypothetical protein
MTIGGVLAVRGLARATLLGLVVGLAGAGCVDSRIVVYRAPPPDETYVVPPPAPEWTERSQDPSPVVESGPRPGDAVADAPVAPVSTRSPAQPAPTPPGGDDRSREDRSGGYDLEAERRSPDARTRPGEREVLGDGRFSVLSDADLPDDKARRLVARLKEASAFVEKELRWQDPRRGAEPIELHVLKSAHMKELYKNALGIASGRHSVIMADDFLDEERSERTLAHELTHVQDRQHLQGGRLPHYVLEGRAIVVARAFGKSLEIEPAVYDERLARAVARVTAADARKMLRDEAYLSEARMEHVGSMEAVGFFFLEVARVRLEARLGNMEARLSRIVDMVGDGTSFEAAWSLEMEETLATTQSAFLTHMQRTEGDPAARFRDSALSGALRE